MGDVIEASGANNASSLLTEANARLAEAGQAQLTNELAITESRYRYKEQYDLGDLVNVELPRLPMQTAQVIEVNVSLSPTGRVTAVPRVGDPPQDLVRRLRRMIRRVGRVNKR